MKTLKPGDRGKLKDLMVEDRGCLKLPAGLRFRDVGYPDVINTVASMNQNGRFGLGLVMSDPEDARQLNEYLDYEVEVIETKESLIEGIKRDIVKALLSQRAMPWDVEDTGDVDLVCTVVEARLKAYFGD